VPSVDAFESALRRIPRPRGRQLDFLQAHYDARARGLNARKLAKAARYQNYRPINLHYGLLAARVAQELKVTAGIELLVDSLIPHQASNDEWILIMRPNFARALKRVGWVA
jgi:hypothetical protein